jgi:tRNA nucleotidyltransferase (CCA-adding enzyme)
MPLLTPPTPVLEIADSLERSGFEAWCVGGAVRDALLGHPHLDWDLATSATPDEVRAIFGKRRTIPVGIQFGTVGVLDRDGTLHEVTTFRRDVRTDGRHAEVEFGANLEEDLARRDFTINAIAYSPSRDELRDPFHGRADLARRLVRAVGDPDARMREDRLRALRAIRFAARFAFELDPATLAAVERSAPAMGRLSAERVQQELKKTMEQVECPGRALSFWRNTGILATVIPALATLADATIASLDFLAPPVLATKPYRTLARIAVLFVELGDREATRALGALRFSGAESRRVAGYARQWKAVGDDLTTVMVEGRVASDAEVRRWVAAIGRLDVAPFMRLALALWRGRNPHDEEIVARTRVLYRRMLASARRDPLAIADLTVDGDDLRVAGIPPGPAVGKILQALLALVLEEPTRNTRDWLLQEAQRIWRDESRA